MTVEALTAFVEALPIEEDAPITAEAFKEVLKVLDTATTQQVVAVVEAVLASTISQEQAIQLVVTETVLEAVTETQAEQIFEEVTPELLTDQQAEQIIDAVEKAPDKVKKAFEKVLDIFGSQFESYRALGSNIPVSQRRSLVAIGSLFSMLPTPTIRKVR